MSNRNEIAIIGTACRLPLGNNLSEFSDNIYRSECAIGKHTEDQMLRAGVSAEVLTDPSYMPFSACIDDADFFDHKFFGFSSSEAALLDPQFRLFYKVCYEALDDANLTSTMRQKSVGVFGSSGMALYSPTGIDDYYIQNIANNKRLVSVFDRMQRMMLSGIDWMTTQFSYRMNLHGPSMSIQTACSSSIVSLHNAILSLNNGDCEVAVVGAAAITAPLRSGYGYIDGGIFSSDGRCLPFSKYASGTVGGNGGGAIVLKPLKEAIKEHDVIYAVVKASSINNDGAHKASFSAPGVEGQRRNIEQAIRRSKIDIDDIGYVEAHGTGTAVGDPIEIAALAQAFKGSNTSERCAIGSVKANIGHLDTAAGMASILKAIAVLRSNEIPGQIGCNELNVEIDLQDTPFYITEKSIAWPQFKKPKCALVASLGAGGTNAHLVLQEWGGRTKPARVDRVTQKNISVVLPISARTRLSLRKYVRLFRDYIVSSEVDLATICSCSILHKEVFEYRYSFVADNRDQLIGSMDEFLLEKMDSNFYGDFATERNLRDLSLLLTGRVDLQQEMCVRLFASDKRFAEIIYGIDKYLNEQCCVGIKNFLAQSLKKVKGNLSVLERNIINFSLEYALIRYLKLFGVDSKTMVGVGLGELCAAVINQNISLEQALNIVTLLSAGSIPDEGRIAAYLESLQFGDGVGIFISYSQAGPFNRSRLTAERLISLVSQETKDLGSLLRYLSLKGKKDWLLVGDYEESLLRDDSDTDVNILNCSQVDQTYDSARFEHRLALLFAKGYPIQWNRMSWINRTKTSLPVYPFDEHRHWAVADTYQGSAAQKSSHLYQVFRSNNIDQGRSFNDASPRTGSLIVIGGVSGSSGTLATRLEGWGFFKKGKTSFVEKVQKANYTFLDTADGGVQVVYLAEQDLLLESSYLLNLLQYIMAHSNRSVIRNLVIVSDSSDKIGIQDPYAISGMLQCFRLEYDRFPCKMLIIEDNEVLVDPDSMHDLLYSVDAEVEVFIGEGGVRLSRIKPANHGDEYEYDATATYLLTGAFGGIGLRLAQHMADRGCKHLLMVGRTRPSSDASEKIAAISRTGVSISQVIVDVSVREQFFMRMDEVLNSDIPPVKGIFHLAGALCDAAIINLTDESLVLPFDAKVHGTNNILDYFSSNPMPFVVLFSSVSATFGAPGQSNYAVANSYLNQLSEQGRSQDRSLISVAWGPWEGDGMAKDVPCSTPRLSDRDHWSALDRIVQLGTGQYIVANIDHARTAEADLENQPISEIGRCYTQSTTLFDRDEPPIRWTEKSVGEELEKRILHYVKSGEVSAETAFIDYGLDSVAMIQFARSVNSAFGIGISAVDLYNHPSLKTLTRWISSEVVSVDNRYINSDEDDRQRLVILDKILEEIASF